MAKEIFSSVTKDRVQIQAEGTAARVVVGLSVSVPCAVTGTTDVRHPTWDSLGFNSPKDMLLCGTAPQTRR